MRRRDFIAQLGCAATVRGSMLFNERVRVGASALKHRMPAMTIVAEMVPHGLLLSYGQDFSDFFRRSAGDIDKILKGAKPADRPVEQPTHFKLVINSRTAKALDDPPVAADRRY
jgi:putative tryptophan/tyrosine transport system substrate-binding protein